MLNSKDKNKTNDKQRGTSTLRKSYNTSQLSKPPQLLLSDGGDTLKLNQTIQTNGAGLLT